MSVLTAVPDSPEGAAGVAEADLLLDSVSQRLLLDSPVPVVAVRLRDRDRV